MENTGPYLPIVAGKARIRTDRIFFKQQAFRFASQVEMPANYFRYILKSLKNLQGEEDEHGKMKFE